jgi:spore maturation protein CgeB
LDWPPQFRETHLKRNLAALARRQPLLAERLTWPVADGHLRFEADGAVLLQHQRGFRRLDLGGEARQGVLRRRPSGDPAAPGLLFGVGLGESIEVNLAREHQRRWLAYERDPYLLRLALARFDCSGAIAAGRLEFALGADVFEVARRSWEGPLLAHPLLGALYERELYLLEKGVEGQPAFMVEGELFVDHLAAALRRRGYALYTLDVQRLAVEELRHATRTARPALVAAINYTNGLAEFCDAESVPLLCWEIDPSLDELKPLAKPAPRAHIYTYRQAHVDAFRRAGFTQVAYLPLAADTYARGPTKVIGPEALKYRSPVAFVGASMTGSARAQKKAFLDFVAEVRRAPREQGAGQLEHLLAQQREEPRRYRLGQDLEQHFPDVLAALKQRRPGISAHNLLCELAACEKRILFVSACADFGMDVWGDEGWQVTAEFGVRYKGGAGHKFELNKVYSNAAINLDVGRIYQQDIVTMRVFDVLACQGFCLTEDSDELRRLFQAGHELDTYASLEELRDKINFYLARPELCRQIAERGYRAVRERHTIELRLDSMLRRLLAA